MSNPVVIQITEDDFGKAIDRFLDENKPDKLIERQMKEWSFLWQPITNPTNTEKIPDATNFVAGSLEWKNEYIICRLKTECCWRGDYKDGEMSFSCQAKMELIDKPPVDADATTNKVHRAVIKRLSQDDYIQKLVGDSVAFMDAAVRIAPDILQESVSLENHYVAMAIQRALFSQAETKLDIYELILSFPFLPVTETRLADRLRLRILEDAAFEACEDEEEEKMVEELAISKKQKK